ncbi:uncharacterized protein LOC113351245 [Papaver somniferum]|uniref:uncharacterized protein LOC113351245 n=1 Tax=Papaver somniferum TaxID=3469 RepID=UPI000E6FC8E9|nr:uncharacterized protein LOC113351245 [Papaver somniferum]
MKVNGDTIEDSPIVEKILRSLPEKFESKVTAIEECNTVATMTLDELLGSLQAYEKRLLEKTVVVKQFEEALQSQCTKPRNTTANNYKQNFKANIAESQEEEKKTENMLLACHTPEEQPQHKWYLDTGCSNHMSGRRELFDNLDESVRSTVKFTSKSFEHGSIIRKRLSMNIFNGVCTIRDRFRRLIRRVQMTKNILFPLNIQYQKERSYNSYVHNDSWLWHKRMGHVNFNSLQTLAKKEMVSRLPFIEIPESRCENYIFDKQHRDPFPVNKARRAEQQLKIVHSDLSGPIEVTSHGGNSSEMIKEFREDMVKEFEMTDLSLIYLTATRPDIMYAVTLVSTFMESPRQSHLQAAKRILRYVKEITTLGIFYTISKNPKLVGFTDSDWAGDTEGRKSTSGYGFQLGTGFYS